MSRVIRLAVYYTVVCYTYVRNFADL